MLKNLFLLSLVALLPAVTARADIVLAENGATDYQVVIPDAGAEEIVDHWLLASAKLVQAVFQTNGCPITVVRETERDPNKHGIYLGATAFARANGVSPETCDDWAYHLKVVGRDLIIAGNDRKDPVLTIRRMSTPRALLGTVKGVCDVLREFAGVRFLFLNMDQSLYATRGGGLNLFTPEGALHLDPRSFAFLPTPRIAVPEGLDRITQPLMRANCDFSWETFHYIALNFFPMLSHVLGSSVTWNGTIPPAEYGKSHPDYFALQADGRRACELKIAFDDDMQYCVTHPGVQDLMVQAAEKLIEAGEKTIYLATLDGFCLCRCNCENCTKLFGGIKAENMTQVYERGRSGKLWEVFFAITERVRRKYPEARIVVGDYQDTPINPEVLREFPENVIVKLQFASQLDFDRLKGIRIPAGICGFEESFTGFGQAGPYLPERTPEHMAEVVQAMARNNVKWSARDGSIGYVRGLQAPAYYVYGRMMDDPSADWQAIHKEFCSAAFGNVAAQMERFFDQLHSQIAVYSDYFGVFMPGWNRKYARAHFRDSKWHVMSMYPPEYCAAADALLASAERQAQGANVKARLHLLRIEFDYIRTLAKIFFLQNAWTLNPSRTTMDPLLATINGWHAFLAELASETGSRGFKPLDDWPEMRPFGGHSYSHAALTTDRYQQQWAKTCLNWDTAALRGGILEAEHRLPVQTADGVPALGAPSWAQCSETVLRERGGMPYTNVRTTFKVLRDAENLYVRVESLYPSKHPEDMYPAERDGDAVLKEDHVELGLQPPGTEGKVYRIAGSPVVGARYDALFTPDARKRMTEDKTWDGNWTFEYAVTQEKGRWNLGDRVWTAWFKIPFADFGAAAPAAGEAWGFNVIRGRRPHDLLVWGDAANATDPAGLGQLAF